MDSEFLLVDSSKRENGTPSSFNFKVGRSIRNIKSVELVHASFYNSIYNFTTDDSIIFQMVNDIGQSWSIWFQNKSYTIDELILYMNTQLASSGLSGVFTCSYDASTFKITVTNSTTPFRMYFFSSLSPYRQLGFNKVNTTFALTHVSDNSIDLNSTDYLLVTIDKIGTSITTKRTAGTFYLPLANSNRGAYNVFNSKTDYQQVVNCTNVELGDFHVMICDDKDALIKCDELQLKMLLKIYY